MGRPVDRLKTPKLTSCIEMIASIVCDNYVCLFHHSVMPDPVLLQGPGVEYSNPDTPHTRNHKQYYFIAPKISLEQQMQVLSV